MCPLCATKDIPVHLCILAVARFKFEESGNLREVATVTEGESAIHDLGS